MSQSSVVEIHGDRRKRNWEDVPALCSLGSLIESKIAHEISLLGHRMTWLVISESFLFSAFSIILTSANMVTKTAPVLLLLLPSVGIAVVLFVYPSLFAAHRVMAALLRSRSEIERKLISLTQIKLPELGGLTDTRNPELGWTLWCGSLPVWCVPAVILVAWILVLLIRISLSGL